MFDLLLAGGQVVDGLGGPAVQADVGIENGRIAAVGNLQGAEAARTVDCQGLCVSPGWVDIHGHADFAILDESAGLNLLIQGCTLTVAGNCGQSPVPATGHISEWVKQGDLQDMSTRTRRRMLERYPTATWGMSDFLAEVEKERPGVNYVQLASHGELRYAVMGRDPRVANAEDIRQMSALLEQAMEQGAFGFSTGLVFPPAYWSDTAEIVALAKIAARRGGLYTSHVRGERETGIEATQEFIETAEHSGVRSHMSHMQSKYPILGAAVQKMEMLSAALSRGVDVSVDTDAFPGCGGGLGGFLQIYYYTPEQLLTLISTPEGRAEIKHKFRTIHPWHPLGKFGPGGVPFRRAWERVMIWDCPHDRSLQGKSIAAVAAQRGIEPEDALFDLTVAEQGRGPRCINDYIEDDHWRTAGWDHCILPCVDHLGFFDPASISPLDWRYCIENHNQGPIGFFPRVLGQYVREEKLLTLEEAVRKMTSYAMQRIGITDRGAIRPGMWADITVFDRDTIAWRSANPDPERAETCYPVGIHYVLVNGQVAMTGHTHTEARAGQVLRKA